jgi:fluoride exporter
MNPARQRRSFRGSARLSLPYLWIAFGSALGGVARFGCTQWAQRVTGPNFPWGTLTVNVAGSLIIGFFATLSGPEGRLLVSPNIRQFVMVGFCGGYTTFSSFSLDTLELIRRHAFPEAAFNILCSTALCLVFVWLGYLIAAALNSAGGRSRSSDRR